MQKFEKVETLAILDIINVLFSKILQDYLL